jgi:hypothetical protein
MTISTAWVTAAHVPDREAIRADLESARAAFHELLDSLSDADLEQPCAESRWTVKQLLYHLVFAVETAMPMMVKRACKRQNMPKFFHRRLGHWLNYLIPALMARLATCKSIAQRYDAAHKNLLNLLTEVRDDEWNLPTSLPNQTPLTMETVFCRPKVHFEEHVPSIRQVVRRGLGQIKNILALLVPEVRSRQKAEQTVARPFVIKSCC